MTDLHGLIALQSFGEFVFGARDIAANANSVFCEWMTSCNGSDEKDFIEKNLIPFENDPEIKEAIRSRLFNEESKPNDGSAPYRVVPLEDIGLGIVIYPGAFAGVQGIELHFNLIQDTLKQLYVYEELPVIAKEPITLRYLEHLLRQRP